MYNIDWIFGLAFRFCCVRISYEIHFVMWQSTRSLNIFFGFRLLFFFASRICIHFGFILVRTLDVFFRCSTRFFCFCFRFCCRCRWFFFPPIIILFLLSFCALRPGIQWILFMVMAVLFIWCWCLMVLSMHPISHEWAAHIVRACAWLCMYIYIFVCTVVCCACYVVFLCSRLLLFDLSISTVRFYVIVFFISL